MGDGQLQPEDTLDDRGVDDILDEGISPPENYRGVTAKGVTAREELEGETLEERMRQEEPEVWEQGDEVEDDDSVDFPTGREVGSTRTGRLLAEGSDDDRFAEDEGIDGAGASAEEAAVHTIEE
ncbi:DUF5709 domain-containing protein [Nocardioides sp.]|uniref:DUF5709 domain-containing protein n=1 Tax=Nocardioides sp. TaxID=35761 RepID=UPI003568645C